MRRLALLLCLFLAAPAVAADTCPVDRCCALYVEATGACYSVEQLLTEIVKYQERVRKPQKKQIKVSAIYGIVVEECESREITATSISDSTITFDGGGYTIDQGWGWKTMDNICYESSESGLLVAVPCDE